MGTDVAQGIDLASGVHQHNVMAFHLQPRYATRRYLVQGCDLHELDHRALVAPGGIFVGVSCQKKAATSSKRSKALPGRILCTHCGWSHVTRLGVHPLVWTARPRIRPPDFEQPPSIPAVPGGSGPCPPLASFTFHRHRRSHVPAHPHRVCSSQPGALPFSPTPTCRIPANRRYTSAILRHCRVAQRLSGPRCGTTLPDSANTPPTGLSLATNRCSRYHQPTATQGSPHPLPGRRPARPVSPTVSPRGQPAPSATSPASPFRSSPGPPLAPHPAVHHAFVSYNPGTYLAQNWSASPSFRFAKSGNGTTGKIALTSPP